MLRLCLCFALLVPGSLVHSQVRFEFPTRNALWSEISFPPFSSEINDPYPVLHAVFEEDTTIGGLVYSKLFELHDTVDDFSHRSYVGGLRSDAFNRVYYYPTWVDEELLLYDFSAEVGDTLENNYMYDISGEIVVSEIDSILVGDQYRKRFHFEPYPDFPVSLTPWIEGIGNMRGLLFHSGDLPNNGLWGELVCLFQADTLVYHSAEYETCFPLPLSSPELKMPAKSLFELYPNPASSVLILRSRSPEFQPSRILLYDSMGRKVYQCDRPDSDPFFLDVSPYPNGMYVVEIQTHRGESHSAKLNILK